MAMNSDRNFKAIAKMAIVSAGKKLVEQAEQIVADIDTNDVNNIYITVNIDRGSIPTIDIQKQILLIRGE